MLTGKCHILYAFFFVFLALCSIIDSRNIVESVSQHILQPHRNISFHLKNIVLGPIVEEVIFRGPILLLAIILFRVRFQYFWLCPVILASSFYWIKWHEFVYPWFEFTSAIGYSLLLIDIRNRHYGQLLLAKHFSWQWFWYRVKPLFLVIFVHQFINFMFAVGTYFRPT